MCRDPGTFSLANSIMGAHGTVTPPIVGLGSGAKAWVSNSGGLASSPSTKRRGKVLVPEEPHHSTELVEQTLTVSDVVFNNIVVF